jgi:hypothetical protein
MSFEVLLGSATANRTTRGAKDIVVCRLFVENADAWRNFTRRQWEARLAVFAVPPISASFLPL